MGRPDEEIAVYDQSGQLLGTKVYSDLTDNDTWQIICIWLENSKGEVLLQQRAYKKKLGPGLWTCAVEGTVEKGDSFDKTAQKEIAEEIGLSDCELIPTKKVYFKAQFGSRIAQGYFTRCDWSLEQFTPEVNEVEQLKWEERQSVINAIKTGDSRFPIHAKVWLDMFNLE